MEKRVKYYLAKLKKEVEDEAAEMEGASWTIMGRREQLVHLLGYVAWNKVCYMREHPERKNRDSISTEPFRGLKDYNRKSWVDFQESSLYKLHLIAFIWKDNCDYLALDMVACGKLF